MSAQSGRVPQPVTLRAAVRADGDDLLQLWSLVVDADDQGSRAWRGHAAAWFARVVDHRDSARFPVIEIDGVLVATAIATLDIGVPNPHCVRGRTVRLANVVTAPEHRRRGHATRLLGDVVSWARSIDADRVDLSATPDGRRLYERLGFVATTAPRMKLVLEPG